MTLLAHPDHEQSITRCTTCLSSRCFWSDCWVERLSLSRSSRLDPARFSWDFDIASGIPDYIASPALGEQIVVPLEREPSQCGTGHVVNGGRHLRASTGLPYISR